jgi:transaldolase / glucose-6-phosphate isomerase
VSAPDLTVRARLPEAVQSAVSEALERVRDESVPARLQAADATLWGPEGTPEIANRLGWLTIAERMLAGLGEVEQFSAGVRADGLQDVVLLGMGGSSLAPEVLRRTFPATPGHPRLHVLDSTDAATIAAVQDAVELEQTLFIVSSKSGGTIEPLSLFAHFNSLVPDGANFAAITDPGSGLERLAAEHGFRHTFFGDPDIGGRYSALSPFGIVPATLIGIDTRTLLSGAGAAKQATLTLLHDGRETLQEIPAGVWLGAALAAMAGAGRDKLTFQIADTLPGLGLWLEQLVAESTGKQGRGILPVAEEPLGDPDAYGPDRVFAYLPDLQAPDAEADARLKALADAGQPVLEIPVDGPLDLGRVFLLAELAIAVAGWGLRINPFDQPNVQQAKDATKSVLAGFEQSHRLPTPPDADAGALRALLLDGKPPQYVALMGYLRPDTEFDRAIAELRTTIRSATKATTTFGYGPRFLHSTGQFHKGGPREGRFLQLLHDGPADIPIPGAAYSFDQLKEAEAIGDFQTLRELDPPAPAVERLRLQGQDPVSALRALTASIKEHT